MPGSEGRRAHFISLTGLEAKAETGWAPGVKKKASTRVEQMQLKNMGEEREQGESRVRTLTVV